MPNRLSSLLSECSDEVAVAKLAAVAQRPGTAPGDVCVAEHHGVGAVGVLHACRGVLDLHVQVWFVRVTAVPDRGERLAEPHDVPHLDRDAVLPEMGQDHIAAAADVHHQIVVGSPVGPQPLEVDSVALVREVTVEQHAAASVQHEPLTGQWHVEHDRIGGRDGYPDELESEEA